MNKVSKVDVTNLLNSNTFVSGLNQVLEMLSAQEVVTVILAEDSDEYLKNQIYNACSKNNIKLVHYESKKELGLISGLNVGTATVAILKHPSEK